MSDIYLEMADMARELLLPDAQGGLGQGVVSLKRITHGPLTEPGEPGTPTVATYTLSAAVKRLHQRYENGVLIVETGDMVTFAVVDGLTPANTDKLVIDGVERMISNVTPIPGAGTVCAWKVWCKS